MKNKIFLIIIVTLFMSGCFISKPAEINKIFLTNITDIESKKIEEIEKKIITIKEEEENTKKLKDEHFIRISINDYEISISNEKNFLFIEKKKLYMATDNTIEMNKLKAEIIINETKRNILNYKKIYLLAKYEDLNSYLKVKEAELGLEIAKKLYEESLLAKKYQSKESTGVTGESSDVDIENNEEETEKTEDFDISEYKEYLNAKKMNLLQYQKERKQKEQLCEIALKKLLKTGFKF